MTPKAQIVLVLGVALIIVAVVQDWRPAFDQLF